MQNDCAELKIRAERKVGKFLKELPKAKNQHSAGSIAEPATLKELGIEKMQSHRYQKEWSVPKEDFEKHIKEAKDKKCKNYL